MNFFIVFESLIKTQSRKITKKLLWASPWRNLFAPFWFEINLDICTNLEYCIKLVKYQMRSCKTIQVWSSKNVMGSRPRSETILKLTIPHFFKLLWQKKGKRFKIYFHFHLAVISLVLTIGNEPKGTVMWTIRLNNLYFYKYKMLP